MGGVISIIGTCTGFIAGYVVKKAPATSDGAGAAPGKEPPLAGSLEKGNPLVGAAEGPSRWFRRTDGQDTWFVAAKGGAMAWSLPAGGEEVQEPPPADAGQAPARVRREWKKVRDGDEVWYQNTATGETSWTRPE